MWSSIFVHPSYKWATNTDLTQLKTLLHAGNEVANEVANRRLQKHMDETQAAIANNPMDRSMYWQLAVYLRNQAANIIAAQGSPQEQQDHRMIIEGFVQWLDGTHRATSKTSVNEDRLDCWAVET